MHTLKTNNATDSTQNAPPYYKVRDAPEESPAKHNIPDLSEKYGNLERIGKGTQATIWRAATINNKNKPRIEGQKENIVALRIFSTNTNILSIQHEYSITKNLKHKNIAKVIDFGKRNGLPCIVMEFIEGRILSQCNNFDPEQGYRISNSIIDAFRYLHKTGTIHNDIHDDNIIIQSSSLEPKIVDFGFSFLSNEKSTRTRESRTNEELSNISREISKITKKSLGQRAYNDICEQIDNFDPSKNYIDLLQTALNNTFMHTQKGGNQKP